VIYERRTPRDRELRAQTGGADLRGAFMVVMLSSIGVPGSTGSSASSS
jgi:hypothetical protein